MTDIVLNIRDQFPILHQKVYGRPLIYFDNAATSQKPLKVIHAISEYYQQENSNIHRGTHYLSNQATEKYEKSREAVRRFINAERTEEIILTKGTTESINLALKGIFHKVQNKNLVTTSVEHKAVLDAAESIPNNETIYIQPNKFGQVTPEQIESRIDKNTKLVSVISTITSR